MERLPTNYNSIKDLEYISSEDILACELNAALLDLPEIFELLFIEPKHLSTRELDILTRVHLRGRRKAIADASATLFQRMRDRNGTAACIEFLQNCGKFSIDAGSSSTSGSKSSGGFNFNVFMDEQDSTHSTPKNNDKNLPKDAPKATLAEAS